MRASRRLLALATPLAVATWAQAQTINWQIDGEVSGSPPVAVIHTVTANQDLTITIPNFAGTAENRVLRIWDPALVRLVRVR